MSEEPEPALSEWEPYRRALVLLALGAVAFGALLAIRGVAAPPRALAAAPSASPTLAVPAPPPSEPAAATPPRPRLDQRVERCGPVTPPGEDHFAAPRELSMGEIWIPKQGGHDASHGFDVVVHFHGKRAAKRALRPLSDRVALVGIDLGTLTGHYSKPFDDAEAFRDLRSSITRALERHTGQPEAHIKRLVLSGWSAGVGAIPTLLKRFSEDIAGVALLDGLHAGWRLDQPSDLTERSVEARYLTPVLRYAQAALRGERWLFVSHSHVPTTGYAPTSVTADRLLRELGLPRRVVDPGDDDYGVTSEVRRGGFTLEGRLGADERAHCAQLVLLADALAAQLPNPEAPSAPEGAATPAPSGAAP